MAAVARGADRLEIHVTFDRQPTKTRKPKR
ncbi:hypothetical protein [Pelagibius sp.]